MGFYHTVKRIGVVAQASSLRKDAGKMPAPQIPPFYVASPVAAGSKQARPGGDRHDAAE